MTDASEKKTTTSPTREPIKPVPLDQLPDRATLPKERRSLRRSGRVNGRRVSGVMRSDLRFYNSPSAKTAGLNMSPEQILKRAKRFSTVTTLSRRIEQSEKMEERAKRFSVTGESHGSVSPAKKKSDSDLVLTAEDEEKRQKRLERFRNSVVKSASLREAPTEEAPSELKSSASFDDSVDLVDADEAVEFQDSDLIDP